MRFCLALLVALLTTSPISAELILNELMASNTRSFPVIRDFGDYPDWIEIIDEDGEARSLAPYYLSDDPENPRKWSFGPRTRIAAGEHLIVIADGSDARVGETVERPYWPFRSHDVVYHHTNFSLSSAGETLLLSKQDQDIVASWGTDTSWEYRLETTPPPEAWKSPDFQDTWLSGLTPIGWGEPNLATELDFGPDPKNKPLTSYYRLALPGDLLTEADQIQVDLIVDDGAAVFFNGSFIGQQNFLSTTRTFSDFDRSATKALTQDLEGKVTRYTIPSYRIRTGENVLAIEVHQITRGSRDSFFQAEVTAVKNRSSLTEIDRIDFGPQVSDVSLGKGENQELINFALPTPGAANRGPRVSQIREESSQLTFSHPGGIRNLPESVSLTATAGEIRYTLNGDEPSAESLLYTTPLPVGDGLILRARVFEEGKVPGPIQTRSWLPQLAGDPIPVLAITVEDERLFGPEIGIDRNQVEPSVGIGPAVFKGKDAPAFLEFFDPAEEATAQFSVNGALRMGGENNWASHSQRAYNFTTKGKYGDDGIPFQIFPQTPIGFYTSLTIREGGDAYGQSHITDAFWGLLADGYMEVEINRTRPTLLYINGNFWGYYNLRDRWDENWFFQNYGVSPGEYDHIKYHSRRHYDAENGTAAAWSKVVRELNIRDLTLEENYRYFEQLIDMNSLADFAIAEAVGRNSSWSGNRELWKAHAEGSKWRWMIPDMDRTFGNTSAQNRLYELLSSEPTLSSMVRSPHFRDLLLHRYALHLETTFSPQRFRQTLFDALTALESVIDRQSDRWPRGSSASRLSRAKNRILSFSPGRELPFREFAGAFASFSEAWREVRDSNNLPSRSLSLVGENGSFSITGSIFPAGTYHLLGPPLASRPEVTAIPDPGFRFDRWEDGVLTATREISSENTPVFVPIDSTLVAGTLARDTTWTLANSPVEITADLIIPPDLTLRIEPGVEVIFSPHTNFQVEGTLLAEGSPESPITFTGRNQRPWGGLSFASGSTGNRLAHLRVTGTTRGHDPVRFPSGISGFEADLDISHLHYSAGLQPLFFRGGSVTLRDSYIEVPVTGDGINVKSGNAITERCTFLGNLAVDTDAIDYDGVIDGVIRDCHMYRFFGSNSDGIDLGEGSRNILLEGNRLYYISDKAVSVGQGSSIIMRNNLIVGCDQGVGLKDTGSNALIDQNTFVDCATGVAIFEKNFGAGGASATITHCTFSGKGISVSADRLSSASVSFCLAEDQPLAGSNNLMGEADFNQPARLDFTLKANSPALNSGSPEHALDPDGSTADRAATLPFIPASYPFLLEGSVIINEVLANSGANGGDRIELYNPSQETVDLSGWYLSDDGSNLRKYRIEEGSILAPGEYLTFSEKFHFGLNSRDEGRLIPFAISASGETVHLSSATRSVVTHYRHRQKVPATLEGHSAGLYRDRFTMLAKPTFMAENAPPAPSPLVITEIMPKPGDGEAEWLELFVTSPSISNLKGWIISDGFTLSLPDFPVQEGQTILLAGPGTLPSSFPGQSDQNVIRWSSGRLDNNGEKLELSSSGGTFLIPREFVDYLDNFRWPTSQPGHSLQKQHPFADGNDGHLWISAPPTPGTVIDTAALTAWLDQYSLSSPAADADGDGLSNALEYALDLNPLRPSANPIQVGRTMTSSFTSGRLPLLLEESENLRDWHPASVEMDAAGQWTFSQTPNLMRYFRFRALLGDSAP